MPIPRPRKGETRDDFGSRCMEAIGGEYEDKKQAYAICMDTYRESKKSDRNLGEPKNDDERCKEHFGLTDEEWNALPDEKKQEYRDKLPPRGSGQTEKSVGLAKLITKSDERFIIGGYANVYMIDKNGEVVPDYENEVVTLDALDEALNLMMADPSRRNHIYYHTNIQIGEIIWETIDSDGVTWKTHVVEEPCSQYPKRGLFILSKIYGDTPPSIEARRLMEQEGKLLSFSIGGLPLAEEKKCDSYKCWTEITQLYLAEVSSCDKGINAESKAFILKQLSPTHEQTPNLPLTGSNKEYNYIGENPENQVDDTPSAEDSSDEEQIHKTEQSQIVEDGGTEEIVEPKEENTLDNENLENEAEPVEEPVVEDEEQVEKSPESVEPKEDEPVEKTEEEPEEEEEEPVVEKTDEPLREDFDSLRAYSKALAEYVKAEAAKEPVTMKTLDEKLEEFKKSLLESLKDVEIEGVKLGETVKKSVRVKRNVLPVAIDLKAKENALYKTAEPRLES